jgi:hypothetical protein
MKTFKNFREGVDIQEAPMDGVAKGSLPDDQHMCATKIFKEGFGEGTPILGEHSLPDADGNVAWYKVMFEHGVEIVTVGEEGVAVLEESNHGNHKKKMKEEVEEIEEISKKTLGSYIKKATGEVRGNSRAGKDYERDAKSARSDKNKNINNQIAMNFSKRAAKRKSGIETAADKLVNKKTDD